MLSYWERASLLHYDLVIVGGGIVGSFTALFYAEKHPEARIALIERGLFSDGASTKNAGFACFGSIAELEHDLQKLGPERTVDLVVKRYHGLQTLRAQLGDAALDFRPVGGYEVAFHAPDLTRLDYFNDLLQPALKARPYSLVSHEPFGFGSKVTALVKNELEGTVHTGKMMATLQQKVARAGVVVYANTEVLAVEKRNEGMRIEVEHAGKRINFVSTQVALTTNAFTKTFLPDLDLQPGRGLVLVTKPHPALRWEGSFHYHDGYHYFRTIDGRLLLGGGRQLDVQGEQTTEKGVNPLILQQLQADIEDFIAPGVGLEVDYCWSGTMAFGHDKNPVVQRIHEGLVAGVRLGGMGVAIGAGVGRELAAILEG